jgi:DNA-directed RNA polymerase subunit L
MGGGIREGGKSWASDRDDESKRAYESDKAESITGYQGKPRVFISFHMNDEAQVNLLRHQARNSENLEFTDYSVKEPFDEKWKTNCALRIEQSSIVIVAIGPDTYSRPAVLWEIEKAHEMGKPVIGMRLYSERNHRIPEPMLRHNDKVVPWSHDVLQSELDKLKGGS